MDVQCERCKTEYEFDDALVSGRGTTVRCTTCGHQFKVHLSGASGSEPPQDKWLVQLAAGSQVTYLTLRELQRAIVARHVSRGDTLLRGEGPPRRLGSIAELEPFFDGRASTRPPPPSGVAGGSGSDAKPLPPVPAAPLVPHLSGMPEPRAPSPSMNSGGRAQWGDLSPPGPPVSRKPAPLGYATPSAAPVQAPLPPPRPRTISRPAEFDIEAAAAPVSLAQSDYALDPEPATPRVASPLETPPSSRRPSLAPADPYAFSKAPPMDPMAEAMRVQQHFDSEPAYLPKRRTGGWLIFGVLFGGVVVVGGLVARPYFASKPSASAVPNSKLAGLVQEGEAALSDGDLELAGQAFDKASVLSETDPHLAIDLARVAVATADVAWLRLRLSEDSDAEKPAAEQQLKDRLARARKAVDAALLSAPTDLAAIRAKVDVLRMAGDRDGARRELGRLSSDGSADTAYSTGALELAETNPSFAHAADKLRSAANGEGRAARARAALVYALAAGGDGGAAEAELQRLADLPRVHPLLGLLRGYVAKAKRSVDAAVTTHPVATPVAQLPQAGAAPPQPVQPEVQGAFGGTFAGASGAVPGDSRVALEQAEAAKRKRDWARAKVLYNALVDRNPSDSEALAGQADVAKAQGDLPGAAAGYKRAIAVNPSYLPALLGLADSLWDSGDRATAAKRYREIVDRFPEGTYPAAVKTRLEPPPAPVTAPTTEAPTTKPVKEKGAQEGAKAAGAEEGDETP